MIHLYFVGDGPRDEATLPRLVERILEAEVTPSFPMQQSFRFHGSRGYRGQVRFAIRAARDANASGVVMCVDADKAPKRQRLRELHAGREADRASAPPFPTALGEAVPHGEAWLLDDPVAVKRALQLAADVEIPTVRQTKDPKGALQALIEQSEIDADELLLILAGIARELHPSRCRHDNETGFNKFANEVRRELGPLVPQV